MSFKCSACGIDVSAKDNFVKFLCPNCGKNLIVRCKTCKNLSNKYTCECGFTGP